MHIVTADDRADLQQRAGVVLRERWPEFIFHDQVAGEHIGRVGDYFGRYNILVLDDEDDVLAGGWGVPMPWDGTADGLPAGYDDAMVRAVNAHEDGTPPTTLSFMAAAVGSAHDKRGLAGVVLRELTRRAHNDGLRHVVAPLRPTWKHRYPDVPMAEYVAWRRADGLPVDPWLRTHERMGATVLGVAARSMVIEGSVAEWESWTGLAFPVTRDYIVPDALNLVRIDRERDRGVYVEENVWVRHG